MSTIEEKAKNWDRLSSAVEDPNDFKYLEYIVIKPMGKEPKIVRFG
jgi:hypothetical protein